MKAALSVYVWRNGEDDLLKFSLSIRMRKNSDFSDFERSVVVRLSSSETADLLGFSPTTISVVYRG